MLRTIIFSSVLVSFLAIISVNATERSATTLSYACAGCHGTAGVSAGTSIPSLAGLPSEYFIEAMQKFKNGKRGATIMDRIAKAYSNEEIVAMAGFFEQQTWVAASIEVDAEVVAQGQTIHEDKCARCHLAAGKYTEYRLPRIGGQWADYLYFYMKNAQIEGFKQPQPKLMKKSLEGLTEAELTALAQFYAAQ